MNSAGKHSWRLAAVWIGLLGLAAALRAYHLTGFVVNNDEGHWLLYALDRRLLLEPLQNSYPRPDLLFPLLVSAMVKLFGPNELALRLWPMVAGSVSLIPLGILISRITKDRVAGLFGAAFLAVLPLHVYYSAAGTPDTIALFLGLCALVFLMRARQTKAFADFLGMELSLALALMMKATALYGWGFMAVAGMFLFEDRKLRRRFYQSLALAAAPLLVVTIAIWVHGRTLSFFHEPGVTETFGFTAAKFLLELRYLAGFYEALLLAAAIGAVLGIWRAVAAFEKVREINPNEPVSSVNLAMLYYQLGRDADGIAQCQRNIHAAIETAVSYGVLGQIRERHGDLAAAQAAYEQSLALDPHNPTTVQLLANLKARRLSSGAPAR